MHPPAILSAIATATPATDVHAPYVAWAADQLTDRRERAVFERMAARAGIDHRWSVLAAPRPDASPVDPGGFYGDGTPGTAARMARYAEDAPALALAAIAHLPDGSTAGVTHLVVASCTGFTAPGLDQRIAAALGLSDQVERTLIGFMGCYAAVVALRTARHIVRSDRHARVLVVTVELSTLHLQPAAALEPLLAQLLFADGAAAAIIAGNGTGFLLHAPFSRALPDSEGHITWTIGDTGFGMTLSGEVPHRIRAALGDPATRAALIGDHGPVDAWAIHAGGRTVLDAAEDALGLPPDALDASRAVLRDCGNMSSSTLMFVLARLFDGPRVANGRALAFGPGLAVEGIAFRTGP